MTDDDYMALAMRQADGAIQRGEQPFGAVIVDADGNPVSMAGQQVKTHPAYHAEIVALAAAGGPGKLQRHTLYSTVEPCPMCSFMARQCQVSRVVFGLWSPLMGGYTHWPILQDTKLNKSELGIADIGFAPPPQVQGGCQAKLIWDQWFKWNAIAAAAMEFGGVFAKPEA